MTLGLILGFDLGFDLGFGFGFDLGFGVDFDFDVRGGLVVGRGWFRFLLLKNC